MKCHFKLLIMIDPLFFLGFPKEFEQLCLIYPPNVEQVITTRDFFIYKQLLTLSQEEMEDIFTENNQEIPKITPFEYLLGLVYNNEETKELVKQAFNFFIHEDVTILPTQKVVIFGDIQENKTSSIDKWRMITEDNFFSFQNAIREACGEKKVEPPREDEDPRIKRIKAKARYRDKIKAKHNGLKLTSTLVSICCMGLNLNPLNIGEISYASALLLMRYFQEKDKYETDIKAILAGADNIKLQSWIRNIED